MAWKEEEITPTKQPKVGLINRAAVNKFLFALVASSILVCVFMIIFAIWDYIGEEVAYKTVATGATVIGGGILFSFVNDYFGSKTISTQDYTKTTGDSK